MVSARWSGSETGNSRARSTYRSIVSPCAVNRHGWVLSTDGAATAAVTAVSTSLRDNVLVVMGGAPPAAVPAVPGNRARRRRLPAAGSRGTGRSARLLQEPAVAADERNPRP